MIKMGWRRCVYTVPLRFRSLFKRSQVESELGEEMQFHLDQRIEQEIRSGRAPSEARRVAMLAMGGLEQAKDKCRDVRRVRVIENCVQDFRYAIRLLIKSPGFTVAAVLALAIGIGANVALFSVVNAVLLRPLPYPSADQLVSIWKWRFPGGGVSASPSDFVAWRDQTRSFSAVAAYLKQTINFSGKRDPQQLEGLRVTQDFFSVLRIKPARGRIFTDEELRSSQRHVAVVTERFWRTHFDHENQPGVAVNLNGELHLVIGVLPAAFTFGNDTPDIYVPLVLDSASQLGNSLSVIARLAPGIEIGSAEAELAVIAARVRAATGESSRINPGVAPLQTEIVGDARSLLLPLFGAVACVLLIGCSTLANLLLARATVREKEMAVRAALGAGRSRLLAQMLMESVVLALLGGVTSVLLAQSFLTLLVSVRPKGLPRIDEVSIDPNVLGFTLILSVLTGLLFGMAPALRSSHVRLEAALKEEGRGSPGRSRQWLRGALVVGQVALSMMLLIGAGLLLNSFVRLVNVHPGFRADHLLTMRINVPEYSYRDGGHVARFFQDVVERVRRIPGVTETGAVNQLPLARGVIHSSFSLRTDSKLGPNLIGDGDGWQVRALYLVTPDYLTSMGTPIVQGRAFTVRDNQPGAPPVVVVNRTFAREFLSEGDPIGRRIHLAPMDLWCTVIGISEDMKNSGLGDNQLWLSKPPFGTIYLPHASLPAFMYDPPWNEGRSMYLAVRTIGDPLAVADDVRRAVWAVDSNQPLADLKTMEQRVMDSVAVRRLGLWPVLIFALIALALAMGGIYGLVAYAVARRTREFGIRMALGASRADVLLLTMKDTIRSALVGAFVGVCGGYWLSRMLASQLFEISETDPATYISVLGLLLASVIFASYVPARRATSIDPMNALRYE